jgi:hypothetical protein
LLSKLKKGGDLQMKKKFLLISLLLLILAGHVSYAQEEMHLGIGANLAIPITDFAEYWASTGFGVTGIYMISIGPKYAFSVQSGYLYFTEKDVGNNIKSKTRSIPIMFGLRNFFGNSETFKFLIGAMAGVHYMKVKTEGPDIGISSSETKFSIAPEIGVRIKQWEISGTLTSISTSTITSQYIGIRAGYNFEVK